MHVSTRWMLAGLCLAAGCSPEPQDSLEESRPGTVESAQIVANSLTPNGLAMNGLAFNGLAFNGLTNLGLATASFENWFNSNPASVSHMVMQYLVRCAVPSGQSRTWTHPSTGVTYTWTGGLGLTPAWAGGTPATETEEQIITACLGAHVNKYGVSMQISLVGRDAQGTLIPTTSSETSSYSQKEATFYGNVFRNEGLYVCKDPLLKLNGSQSTLRACALESQASGTSVGCPPIVITGTCGGGTNCSPDSTKQFHSTCAYNGNSYKTISARIRPEDVYTCGDGICQVSESCGTGTSPSSCLADCGACQ